jgi:aminoglycoside/choline kinase family phosphotransferase
LRSFLEQAQLPVPRSYGREGPIQLLEDGGRCSLEDAAQRASKDARRAPDSVHSREELYAEALQLVPRLQRLSASGKEIPAFGRHLDASLFAYKAGLFAEWALPYALGRSPAESEALAVREAFAWIAGECEKAPARLSHRDFKAANLLVQDAGAISRGAPRLMLIDLQGAFMAPPEYDLVCLLRDPQLEVAEDLVRDALAATLSELPDALPPDEAQLRFDAISFVLQAKILSHVVEAGRSRGDRRRWHEIPRGLGLLEDSMGRIEHAFAPIRELSSVILTLTQSVGFSDIDDSR